MYSVDTEEEAEALLTLACPRTYDGQFVAPELAVEQTVENLHAFGDRLRAAHERLRNQPEYTLGVLSRSPGAESESGATSHPDASESQERRSGGSRGAS